ncbi:hypothetical protein PR048_022505 [Dryococelus australis]|uniref:Uncharacterized protein n=1 Tax=Dryococelus australis TaxID=614101 RepID=A0ABQ9H181_9NEOP|nr:hypothetical protein PR048_022505 [Dryococelus australis]
MPNKGKAKIMEEYAREISIRLKEFDLWIQRYRSFGNDLALAPGNYHDGVVRRTSEMLEVMDYDVSHWLHRGKDSFRDEFHKVLMSLFLRPSWAAPSVRGFNFREIILINNVSTEQRRNEDPRENSPTSVIVRYNSHMRKSGSDPAGGGGIEPGSPRWEPSAALSCNKVNRVRVPVVRGSPEYFAECILQKANLDCPLYTQDTIVCSLVVAIKCGIHTSLYSACFLLVIGSQLNEVCINSCCPITVAGLVRHALVEFDPVTNLQGNKGQSPCHLVWGKIVASANEQLTKARVHTGSGKCEVALTFSGNHGVTKGIWKVLLYECSVSKESGLTAPSMANTPLENWLQTAGKQHTNTSQHSEHH